MKCDDFLPSFAAGGMIRQTQAIFHAARCTHCAAVRGRFLEAKRQWAHPSAVTAVHREVWQRAATTEPLPSARRIALAPKWAFATAAFLLVIVTALILTGLPRRPAVTEVAQDLPPIDALELPALQQQPHDQTTFESIERALDQLAVELNALGKQAALIDARQDVDRLLTTYKPLGVPQPSQSEAN
jgi:hypothetical protein